MIHGLISSDLTGVITLRRREEERGAEHKSIKKIYFKVDKNYNNADQKNSSNSKKINAKKTTPSQSIIKLIKPSVKGKIIKATRGKRHIKFRGKTARMTTDLIGN